MTRVLHQLRKDLRDVRWPLLLWVAVLAGATVFVSMRPDQREGLSLARVQVISFLLMYAVAVASWLLAIRVVHGDPAEGTTAFWLTRPITPVQVLLSKLALIVSAFVLLPAGAHVAAAAANGIRGPFLLHLFAESALLALLFVSFFTLLAALTRDLARMTVAALLGAIAWPALRAFLEIRSLPAVRLTDSARLDDSRLLVATVLVTGGIIAVIASQYLTRRVRRSALLALAVTLCSGVIAAAWPWNLLGPLRTLAPTDFDSTAIRLSFSDATASPFVADGPRVRITASVRISGTPSDWAVLPLSLRTSLRFQDGRSLSYSSDPPLPSPLFDATTRSYLLGLNPSSMTSVERVAHARVINNPWNPSGDLAADRSPEAQPLLLVEAAAKEVAAHLPTTVGLESAVTCAAFRTRIAAAVPLRAGSEARTGSLALRIMDVTREQVWTAGDSLELAVRMVRSESFFPGSVPAFVIAVRHASRPEMLVGFIRPRNSAPLRAGRTLLPRIDYERISFSRTAAQPITIDDGWIAGAKLLVFTLEERGTFTKMVRVPALVLTESR